MCFVIPLAHACLRVCVPVPEVADGGHMRAALSALRHVLKHPLTDANDDALEPKSYAQPTASMRVCYVDRSLLNVLFAFVVSWLS